MVVKVALGIAAALVLCGVYMLGRSRPASSSQVAAGWTSALAGVTSALLAVGTIYFAYETKERLDAQDALLEFEQAREFADNVRLQVAPQYATEHVDLGPDSYVVINASGMQLQDVWIEGTDDDNDFWIKIGFMERCTVHQVPEYTGAGEPFNPVAVHFQDLNGRWRRTVDKRPEAKGEPMPPKPDGGFGTAGFVTEAEDC